MTGKRYSGIISEATYRRFSKTDFAEALLSAVSLVIGTDATEEHLIGFIKNDKEARKRQGG